MKRSQYDFEWADRVWERYQRRRDLPNRQMRAALEEVVAELLRPLALAGDWLDGLRHRRGAK